MAIGFLGNFEPRLDDKGRLTLPARHRPAFAGGVLLTKGQDHSLYLFTPEGFEIFAQDAINADITDARARGYQRFLFANTEELTLDSQGRVSISARMREYAGLDRDVVVIGAGRRMEIWDAARWHSYQGVQEPDFAQPERGALGH